MTRAAIDQYLYLLEEAFSGHPEHSLLANVASLATVDLAWVAGGGARSVAAILVHVGDTKHVYRSHAFGDGAMRWDRPGSFPTIPADANREAFVAWLQDAHHLWKTSVEALADDTEMARARRAPWGESFETRWLINVMIQHDLYHAGEINHIRALRRRDDRWAWDPPAG